MKNKIRLTIKNGIFTLVLLLSAGLSTYAQQPALSSIKKYDSYGQLANGVPYASQLGWKVGIQSFTFSKVPLFEAIDLTSALGLNYIEFVEGMKLTDDSDVTFHYNMSPEWREKLKNKLNQAGVELASFYHWFRRTPFPEIEKWFQLARDLNLTIVADPDRVASGEGSMDYFEGLCKKYDVDLVLTNHRKPNGPYWNPEYSLADTKDRSSHLGISVDIGHFMRDGFRPLTIVENAIAAGRMKHFHLRDVSCRNAQGKDITLGQGQAEIREILASLYRHQVKPILMLEYERNQLSPLPELIESVRFINQVCKELQEESSVYCWARDAQVCGSLKIHDKGEQKATIHLWNNLNDSIHWVESFQEGNYWVRMHYSEPAMGGAASLTVGDEQLVSLLEPTGDWTRYETFDLGIIRINKTGRLPVTLKGTQLSLVDGKHQSALPDVHWISFTPTDEEAQSQPVDILSQFNGQPIFNGRDLEGWVGNNGATSEKWFRVENGTIIAGTMEQPIPRNEFIRTTREYGDFELRLKFKMVYPENTDTRNGGVQIRSIQHPQVPYEMYGYQVDIIPWNMGALYDEMRRNDFLGTAQPNKPVYSDREWTSYIIRCEGPRTRIWCNGYLTLDYMEPYTQVPHPSCGVIAQKGWIGLQIHADKNPSEIHYKDIEIEEL